MSKAESHQFHGTLGEKIAQGMKPENLKANLIGWAKDVEKYLLSKSKTKRDKFNTACVAFDEATGKLYFGRNGSINKEASNVEKNPILFGDDKHEGILPKESLNDNPTPWNCAETDAINKSLNDGAKLENIHIYTMHTTKSSFGKPKESCLNCKTAYKSRIKKNHTGWIDD